MPDAPLQCSIDGMPWAPCESPATYTHLETGDHKFEVRAMGFSGEPLEQLHPALYEWEVALPLDTTPPDTRFVKSPPAMTANEEVLVEFTGMDDQTLDIDLEFECLLDGVLLGSCSSVLTTPELPGVPYRVEVEEGAFGRHTLAIRAIDEMGNVDPTPATRSWTYVDLTAPDTEIEIGPEEETEGTIAVFEFLGEDPLGMPVLDFECSLDEADFTPCTSPLTVENLSLGPHVMQVRAVSANGVVDPIPELYEWLVIPPFDLEPPDTVIASAPGARTGPDAVFGFQSNELQVEEFECSVDGEPFSGCEPVLELEGLEPGQHTLQVRAMDIVGRVDPTPASYTWTSVGEPETTILTGPPAISGRQSATFTFNSDQDGVTFMCSVDGSLPAPCSSPFIAGPLTQDGHEFEVWALSEFRYIDGERVQDQTPAEFEWEVMDVTPPDTEILSVTHLGPTDLIEPDSLRFELRGTDNATAWWELEFECQLDDGPWEACDTPFHYLELEELPGGDHVMRIRAVDEFENADPTPAVHEFNSEAGPETTILTGPEPETGSTGASFTFAADPAEGATFECSLDLAEFEPCANPLVLTDVPFGEHELAVRAKGPMGAVDLEPAVWEWASGDVTPPVVTIHDGPDPATLDTGATFTFTIDDPEAVAQCSLDGGPPEFCESPLTYTTEDLALASGHHSGPHTLEITATKAHQLVDGLPATWNWIVDDVTAPDTVIDNSPPAEINYDLPSVFTFSSPEAGVSYECALDEPLDPVPPEFTSCASPPENRVEYSGLEPGLHKLLVRAVDPSLNADPTPAEYTWTNVGPALTTITADVPAAPATTTETEATFSFSSDQAGVTHTCSFDGAPHLPCSSPVHIPDAQVGNHTFEVQSTNRFLHLEEPPASFEWTVEVPDGVILPETELLTTPLELSNESTARFTFSSNVTGSSFDCQLDLGLWERCSSPQLYNDLAEGEHTFAVRARGALGIPDQSPAEFTWTIDLLPNTIIDQGPPSQTHEQHGALLRLLQRAGRGVRVRARRRLVRVLPRAASPTSSCSTAPTSCSSAPSTRPARSTRRRRGYVWTDRPAA